MSARAVPCMRVLICRALRRARDGSPPLELPVGRKSEFLKRPVCQYVNRLHGDRELRMQSLSPMDHGKATDPYRLFFPLGIILGTMGVSIWPLYYYGVTEGYSGRAHAFVQTDGFLYAFIVGFLLTAIPRFTGTEPPSRRVQYALAAIIAISAILFEFQFFAAGQTGFVVSHVMLMTLAVRRFIRR